MGNPWSLRLPAEDHFQDIYISLEGWEIFEDIEGLFLLAHTEKEHFLFQYSKISPMIIDGFSRMI